MRDSMIEEEIEIEFDSDMGWFPFGKSIGKQASTNMI